MKSDAMVKPRFLSRHFHWLDRPGMSASLARGAGVVLVIQSAGSALGYLVHLFFARWMGPTEYGTYTFALTWATLSATLVGLGMPTGALRFIPEYEAKGEWGRLRGFVRAGRGLTLLLSVLGCGLGAAAVYWLGPTMGLRQPIPLIAGLCLVPLLALVALQSGMLRAIRQMTAAFAPSAIVQRVIMIAAVAAVFYLAHHRRSSLILIAATMLALGVVAVLQHSLWNCRRPPAAGRAAPVYEPRQWWSVCWPVLLATACQLVLNQTDILMIGAVLGPRPVGVYNAACKTADLVSFFFGAVTAVAAPMVATLHAQGKRAELQRLASSVAHYAFWPALGIALVLILFGTPVLKLFGPKYVVAQPVMTVLVLTQLLNVATGCVAPLMNLTGHQHQNLRVIGVVAAVNVVLNLIGIHWLGIMGVALATAISIALRNIWLNVLIKRNLGIHSSIIAVPWFKPAPRDEKTP